MGRIVLLACLAGTIWASSLLGSATTAAQALGVFHWGTDYHVTADPKLVEGAKLVQALGAQTIALALTPRYATADYPGETFRPGPIRSDTQLAETTDFQQVLAMPFRTVILLTYTFANARWAFGPHPRGLLTETEAAEETREIHDLTLYLLRTYQGTGKTFVLKNWEGDWFIDEDASYNPAYVPTQTQIDGAIQWFNARHAGLVEARRDAAGLSGVQVLDAVEFNLVDRVRHGTLSLLNGVVPKVQSDLISYSAYQTIAPTATKALPRTIAADVAFIRTFGGNRPLMIGEFGFSEKASSDAGQRTEIAADAFLAADCPYVINWVIEDSPASRGFGLVRSDGSHSSQWQAMRRLLHP